MARWKLIGEQSAYLKTNPPSIYTVRETDTVSGKTAQKVYEVPTEVSPGATLSDGAGAHEEDIIFLGDPTPDMYPLDAEAQAITEEMQHRWGQQFLGLEGNYSDTIGRQIADLFIDIRSGMQPTPMSAQPNSEVAALQQQVAGLMSMVQSLLKEKENGETSGVQIGAIEHSEARRSVEEAGRSDSGLSNSRRI